MKYLLALTLLVLSVYSQPSHYDLEFNRDNNPLHIHTDPKRSNNYFLLIGDWGQHNGGDQSCQYKVADEMRKYVNNMKA